MGLGGHWIRCSWPVVRTLAASQGVGMSVGIGLVHDTTPSLLEVKALTGRGQDVVLPFKV